MGTWRVAWGPASLAGRPPNSGCKAPLELSIGKNTQNNSSVIHYGSLFQNLIQVPQGSPSHGQRFRQPQEPSSPSLRSWSQNSQAKGPKRNCPSENSQATVSKRKFPSSNFQAKMTKRQFPGREKASVCTPTRCERFGFQPCTVRGRRNACVSTHAHCEDLGLQSYTVPGRGKASVSTHTHWEHFGLQPC